MTADTPDPRPVDKDDPFYVEIRKVPRRPVSPPSELTAFPPRHTSDCESCARPTTEPGRRLLSQLHGWPERMEYPWNLVDADDILAIEAAARAAPQAHAGLLDNATLLRGLTRYLPFAPSLIAQHGSNGAADILAGTIASWAADGAPDDPPGPAVLDAARAAPQGLREALRAVLRDFDREPTEEYLTEAERIFLAASPAAPAGLDVEKAANDVRHGGHHLDSYWEGFNDGVDALEARLRAASQPSEDGPADEGAGG